MIVKTLGKKLLIDTKLHLLIYKLSPLFISLCILVFLNLIPNQQKNKFQQPTLRTKIYDFTASSTISQPLYFEDSDVFVHSVEGLISGECLLISFINNSFQKKLISQLSDALKNEKVLTKTIIFVGYNTKSQLNQWIQNYQQGTNQLNFGVIRAAVDLNLNETATGISIDFYGDNGRHSDTDYYYYLVEMMNKLKIKNKICEIKLPVLKPILSYILKIQAAGAYNYINSLMCSLKPISSHHSALISRGIQSASLKSALMSNDSTLKSSQILSLLFSWAKQFSLQEDNLHSSYTLFYPVSKEYYITAKIYIIPYLIFLLGVVAILLHQYLTENRQVPDCNLRTLDFLFLTLLLTSSYYKPGLYIIGIFGLLILSKLIHGERSFKEFRFLRIMVILASVLTGVYNCIIFMPGTFINYVATLLLMFPRQILRILVAGGISYWIYYATFAGVKTYLQNIIDQGSINLLPAMYIATYILL